MDRGSTRARRVLITGAAGLIGTVLMRGLEDRYVISGVDRARRRPKNVMRMDLAKSKAVHGRAYDDADAVIDLAGIPDVTTAPDAVWKNNIPATMNSLEAARRAGVRRYIFASSNHVTGMYEQEWPWSAIVAGDYAGIDPHAVPLIGTTSPIRPDSAYAVGKALGEVGARWYSDTHGLSAICLRIGTVNRADRPESARHFATLLTHADLVRLVECALEAPEELRFGVYYGVSRNTWRFWDISDAAADIGYDPRDDAERLR
jgi:nucleoside-diphosphate-sugar epimerase